MTTRLKKDEAFKCAVQNIKALIMENKGKSITKEIYKKSGLKPSVSYIDDHLGWSNVLKEAGVIQINSSTTEEELIQIMKNSIKAFGYIPTRQEYEQNNLKPSIETLSRRGIKWADAMQRAGFKTYGKPAKVRDRICYNAGCFTQFTPKYEQHWFCIDCQKIITKRMINKINIMTAQDIEELKSIAIQLATSENPFVAITRTFGIDKRH